MRTFKKMSLGAFEELFLATFDKDGYDPLATDEVQKDLQLVNFDFENASFTDAYENLPVGFHVLDNGMPCVFANAGGDWEHPVGYIVYHDGETFRAYIPHRGNVWNRITKTAFGSEQEVVEDDQEKLIEGVKLLLREQSGNMEPRDVEYFELNIKDASTAEIDTDLYKFVNAVDMFNEIMDTIKEA
jgi:hypothetical protein